MLAATEIVRRAEQGIAAALRRGQRAGTVARRGQSLGPNRPDTNLHDEKISLRSVGDYLPGGRTQSETFAMTDGVSDEEFESAITTAKTEGNLSRANVVRKIRASADSDAAERPATVEVTGRSL